MNENIGTKKGGNSSSMSTSFYVCHKKMSVYTNLEFRNPLCKKGLRGYGNNAV